MKNIKLGHVSKLKRAHYSEPTKHSDVYTEFTDENYNYVDLLQVFGAEPEKYGGS